MGINSIILGFFICLIETLLIYISKKMDKKVKMQLSIQNQKFSELFVQNKLTYLYNMQDINIKQNNSMLEKEFIYRRNNLFISSITSSLYTLLQTVALYFLIFDCFNKSIDIGTTYLIIYYTKQSYSFLRDWLSHFDSLINSLNSSARIIELLKNEYNYEKVDTGERLGKICKEVKFENVNFFFQNKRVIHNLSFTIKPGDKVALIGDSGRGKTTLLKLLMRVYDIESGKIYFDNKEIDKISKKVFGTTFHILHRKVI